MPNPVFRGGGAREEIERQTRLAHPGAEASERPPVDVDVRVDTRRDMRALKPWWRRAKDSVVDAGGLVAAIASICTATIAGHLWIKGLVSEARVEEVVRTAVVKALLESNARIANLETATGGLPDWRGKTTVQDAVQDTQIQELRGKAANCEQQLYTITMGRGRR